MMEPLKKFLLPAMAKKGLAGAAVAAQVCFYADSLGKDRFDAISFSQGVLKIAARDCLDAGEIQLESEKIISFVNQKMRREIVKKIRIINSS